jgi:succinoglycan biosynthesis protein ExoM
MSRGDLTTVDIGIPTYRRASELRALLNSLLQMTTPDGLSIRIVVVDNDVEGSAKAIVEEFKERLGPAITYIVEPKRGLSNVRNRILSVAKGDFLAMVDDDEIVTQNWLSELVICANQSNADAVIGRVERAYPPDTPNWVRHLNDGAPPLDRALLSYGATSNVLIRLRSVASRNLWFDSAFNFTGGEDTDFFARFSELGGKFVFSERGRVIEPVTPSRLKWRWFVRRNFRVGQTNASVFGAPKRRPLRRLLDAICRAASAPLLVSLGVGLFIVDKRRGALTILTAVRTLGYAAAILGVRAEEYSGE